MKLQTFSVVLFVFLIFLGATVWRVDHLLKSSQMNALEGHSKSQLAAMTVSFSNEFKNYSALVQKGLQIANDDRALDFLSAFEAVVVLKNSASAASPGLQRSLGAGKVKDWLAAAGMSKMLPQQSGFFLIRDQFRQNKLLFSLSLRNKSQAYALIQSNFLQNQLEAQKGYLAEVQVITQEGVALAHSVKEYVGSNLKSDPVIQDFLAMGLPNGGGRYQNSKDEKFQAYFEQIPDSNVFVILRTPVSLLAADRMNVLAQLAFMGLGLLAFMGAFLYALPPVASKVQKKAPGLFTEKPAVAGMNLGSSEKIQVFQQVASTFAHELNPQINSLMYQLKNLKSHLNDSQKVEELSSQMESRLRGLKNLISKMIGFAGEDKYQVEERSVVDVIEKALLLVEGKIQQKRILVNKNFMSKPNIRMAQEQVLKILESVLLNSIEAMERVARKEMTISLMEQGPLIFIQIQDTGEGIEPQNLGKIFDPFFTTKSAVKHMGLGLSSALGLSREMNGDMEITSEVGKGTIVTIKLDSMWDQQSDKLKSAAEVKNKFRFQLDSPTQILPLQVNSVTTSTVSKADDAPAKEASLESETTSAASKNSPLTGADILMDDSVEKILEAPDLNIEPLASDVVPNLEKIAFESKIGSPQITAQIKKSSVQDFSVEVRKPKSKIKEPSF